MPVGAAEAQALYTIIGPTHTPLVHHSMIRKQTAIVLGLTRTMTMAAQVTLGNPVAFRLVRPQDLFTAAIQSTSVSCETTTT